MSKITFYFSVIQISAISLRRVPGLFGYNGSEVALFVGVFLGFFCFSTIFISKETHLGLNLHILRSSLKRATHAYAATASLRGNHWGFFSVCVIQENLNKRHSQIFKTQVNLGKQNLCMQD